MEGKEDCSQGSWRSTRCQQEGIACGYPEKIFAKYTVNNYNLPWLA